MDLGIYSKPYNEVEKIIIENCKNYRENPGISYLKPFKIVGNLYYVGDKKVCAHLIDTGSGLILFDAGYEHTTYLLENSIEEAGFNLKDIKWLIISHGHFDHFGACNRFRTLYGVKTFMSKKDCQMLRENEASGLLDMYKNPNATLPIIDYEFDDGEILKLGNTQIKCVLSPGHSQGTTSFFFDVFDGAKTYKVGYFGGVGFLTLYNDFLKKYNQPLSLRSDFLNTLNSLKGIKVDITLGNHPVHNHTLEKLDKMLKNAGDNPFINASEWDENLEILKEQYLEFIKNDK
ncbi:MAG: MBL fold metallo-hydrolase [Clostridia bacterium]|nr:MBL fold metallo-hydrolase [Clostridia bacterium]